MARKGALRAALDRGRWPPEPPEGTGPARIPWDAPGSSGMLAVRRPRVHNRDSGAGPSTVRQAPSHPDDPMIPLRDDNPSHRLPVVTYALIAANVAAFLYEKSLGPGMRPLFEHWGLVPYRVIASFVGDGSITAQLTTVFTSLFLHAGWLHLIGNLWYLWIFGDNVEDRLGHGRFVLFYLVCGVAAALAQVSFYPDSMVPMVGASGAIAGVMGAYLYLYPRANVVSLVPILMFLQVLVIPAPVFLGLWFLLQLWQGTFAVGAGEAAGVAWWAHIGGFAAGFAGAWLLGASGQTHPRVTVLRPATDRRFSRLQTPWD